MVIVRTTNGKFFESSGQSLLSAATLAGVSFPYSCKTGRCSTCKCRVISGNTQALHPELGLTETEIQSGWILSCVRTALTDVLLEVDDLGGIQLPSVKTLPCRIHQLDLITADVMRVVLRLPPTSPLHFIAGQYIDLIGPEGLRRSYSLAGANKAENTLELHVRAVEGGAMSSYLFQQAKINDLLRLNGPLGTFFLREVIGKALVFLATGTGIAPIKAILTHLEDLPATQQPSSITLLWGVRQPKDLYWDITSLRANIKAIPVVSRPSPQWHGAVGYVQDILLQTQSKFSNTAVYACGSNAMIQSAKDALVAAGLPSNQFFSDAFVSSGHV